MASTISVTGSPQDLQPGYNPSVWWFKSSSVGQPGYRFYIEVYNTASTLLATYRLAPEPSTNLGVLDVTRLLRNFLSSDYNTSSVQLTPNSWKGYFLKCYDEYSIPTSYTDFVQLGATDITALAVASHPYVVGDQITISQAAGYAYPVLQGVHTVVAGTTPTRIALDVSWGLVSAHTGTHTGTTIFSDNRKTLTFQMTSSTLYVFNGSVPFVDFATWSSTAYKMIAPSHSTKFLTSMPRKNFYIYETQDIRLNFSNFLLGNIKNLDIKNSNGEHYIMGGPGIPVVTNEAVIGVNCGPSSLTAINNVSTFTGSTFPVVKPDTEWYTVQVFSTGGSAVGEIIKINIDRRCRIWDWEILFMDRMGSMLSYSFQLRGDLTTNNDKSTFKKLAGGLVSNTYSYNTKDVGESTYNVNYNETRQLNTNWMDDDMSIYFQELVSSPVTYLKLESGTYVSVIVTNKSMVEQRQKNKRMVKYTIDVKFSNNQNINI